MAYMSRVHRAIGVTPFEMLHGCTAKLAVPAAFATGSLAVCEAAITEPIQRPCCSPETRMDWWHF
jgi:hypothetical protein